MQEIFAVSLTSMHQDMNRLDRVALNLANVSTPGYKREVAGMQPFAEIVSQSSVDAGGASPADATVPPSVPNVLRDVRSGTLKITGEPFDIALTGNAFLEVSTEHGPAYTRQGNLHVDARGRLVTAQGYPVAGRAGDILLTTQAPVIDAYGRITEPQATSGPSATAPGQPIAQLKLVQFENPKEMQRIGDGLMSAGSGMKAADESTPQLRQGALENSNVNSIQEMVQLMQTMRHFESIQKVAQGYDEMLGLAIRKLGDLS